MGLLTFIESSVFPFLPGDSLLFTAGFLASQSILPIYPLFFVVFICAVLGNILGYEIGKKVGPDIFSNPDSKFLKPEHIKKTRLFFQKHGSKALIIARFVPVVRTFIPIFAGVGNMPFGRFITYNIVGALIWSGTLVWGGYYLTHVIPHAEKYIGQIAIVIIIISVAPSLISYLRIQKNRASISLLFKNIFKK